MVHSRLVEAGTDIVVEGEVGDMASKECGIRQLAYWRSAVATCNMQNLRLSVLGAQVTACTS